MEKKLAVRILGTNVAWIKSIAGMPEMFQFQDAVTNLHYQKVVDPVNGWIQKKEYVKEYVQQKTLVYLLIHHMVDETKVGESEHIILQDGKIVYTFERVPTSQFINL